MFTKGERRFVTLEKYGIVWFASILDLCTHKEWFFIDHDLNIMM